MDHLSFYLVEKKHLPIIHAWFEKEHIRQFFYGEGLKNTLKNLDFFSQGITNNGSYSFEHWIAYLDQEPLGFLMTSPIDGPFNPQDPYNKWYEPGKKIMTLDLLIGNEKYLGKGLGHRMIQEFLLNKCGNVTKVLIDPEASNIKAIHVYEKAGFRKIELFTPRYNQTPHWMMHLVMSEMKTNSC